MRFAFFSTKNRKYRHVFEIKSVFFLKKKEKGKKIIQRGHSELNQGPLDLQSNALPLSYTPAAWMRRQKLSVYTTRPSLVPVSQPRSQGLSSRPWERGYSFPLPVNFRHVISLLSAGKSHAIILSCKLLQPFENMEPVCNDISLKI